jgi:hypothetical protein
MARVDALRRTRNREILIFLRSEGLRGVFAGWMEAP